MICIERTILEHGFEAHRSMLLQLSIEELLKNEQNYGFPALLLQEWRQRNAGMLPIQLTEYFDKMGVEFFDEEMHVSVGFDTLYRVRIPYYLIVHIAIHTGVGEPPQAAEEEPAENFPKRPAGLRLVT